MINENIRRARKARGISQEEMAVKLNVVRQTVSKWENGLSVPDADVLIQIADLLEVPVSQFLGVEVRPDETQALAEQLAQLNEELALRAKRERLTEQANKKRGIILCLSFLSLPIAFAVKNETASIIAFGVCGLAALIIYYRNLTLLTGTHTDDAKLRTLRMATICNTGFFVVVILSVIVMIALDQSALIVLAEDYGKIFAMVLIIAAMLFFGFLSPKLPFNRHTGLRLPWTVQDEDTWNVAHRTLGHISLPAALLYLAAALTLNDFVAVTGAAVCLYIGIPGLLSLIFYWKKMHGKL